MTIGYETFGSGPERVIVLHDWMSSHKSFADLRRYLDTAKYTYAFADNRGYGLSRALTGEYSAKEAVADIVELADNLGWEQFHFVGHSMSGMIGQRLSLDAAFRLKSLILVTPVTAAGMPLEGEGKELFEGAITNDDLWLAVAKAVTSERLGASFYESKLQQCRNQVDVAAMTGFLKMWTTTDFSGEMKGLSTPVLVLAGAHDFPAFSQENYESTIGTWYNNSRIETLPGTGHYPMSETPPYFAHALEGFLETNS